MKMKKNKKKERKIISYRQQVSLRGSSSPFWRVEPARVKMQSSWMADSI